jgi:hypothetical protein
VFAHIMKNHLKLFGFAAGLACAASANAQQTPAPIEWVRCLGISAVPMTADATQALPMQITASLACGSEVAVLSDTEGYVANVRTAEGLTGYVARMYLTAAAAPRAAATKPLASAAVENNVARWMPAAAGSDQFYSEDSLVESLTVDGITVQVSLHDTGWKLRADVAVANDGRFPLAITPAHFMLLALAPSAHQLAYQDPQQMASSVSHGVLRSTNSAKPPVAGNVAVNTMFSSTQTPNYLVQTQSEQLSAERHDVDFTAVRQIHNTALLGGSIAPGGKSAGAVWFERDKKAEQLVLRVPVGQTIYEFPLSFSHNN